MSCPFLIFLSSSQFSLEQDTVCCLIALPED